MVKVYTKQGDQGKTQIYTDDLHRVDKDSAECHLYGTLDELNSYIGLLIAERPAVDHVLFSTCFDEKLEAIQQQLFKIGFAVSDHAQVESGATEQLESLIDQMGEIIPPQTSFILPGGHKAASVAHVCRTIARRAERNMVTVLKTASVKAEILQYINRLSDYFFVLARFINHLTKHPEVKV